MSDGPTGFQVAPTEDEMRSIHSILQRAADAIVRTSQLQTTVDELSAKVGTLTNQVDSLINRNDYLDKLATDYRTQRDNAVNDAASAKRSVNDLQVQVDGFQATLQSRDQAIAALRSELEQTKRERDDYGLRTMELEDQLAKADAKIAAIQEGYSNIFGKAPEAMPPPKAPEPQASNPVEVFPRPDPVVAVEEEPWWQKSQREDEERRKREEAEEAEARHIEEKKYW